MSEPRHRLRVLHLSDLHERGPSEEERWRWERVLGDSWDRNLSEILQDGPIDLVCFTGDAANWGLEAEYEFATAFFKRLLERLRLGPDRLFVIPGNHDIERAIHKDVWSTLRERTSQVDRLHFARWMAGGPTPLGLEETWRDDILARQAAYRRWVSEDLGRPEFVPGPHRLGYRAKAEIPGFDFPIHVIGLDTAWLCGDKYDSGHLLLTDSQLMGLATDGGHALPGLRLVLMHHPFSDLMDGSHCRKLLAGHADLVLRGHLHEQTVETWADPDRTVRQLAAGCLYEGARADHWPNACQVATFGLDETGRPLKIDLRFRAFSPGGGHWHDDDSLYEGSRGGRLTWVFERRVTSSPTVQNPYDAWTPAVPPRFVGRVDIFRRLEAALEEGRSVSLVGDWRIGKSSILQTWYQRQNGKGREVRLLSGEERDGISPRIFVETITGYTNVGEGADEAADALKGWAQTTGRPGLPPLILVDEFDGMIPRFEPRFFERVRGMLGSIVLVVASRQEVDLICEQLGRTSPFLNRFELQWVGLLEPEVAEELVAWGRFTASDADLMRRWAGWHPFYLQLLGRCLVEARRDGGDSMIALDRFRAEAAVRLRE
ncbi:MAG TPA: metallophosphoesterase, partial [Thermoanaerobaculia bacterium]